MASHTATYILSAIYRFNADGAAEVLLSFESTSEGRDAICTYDNETESFSLECDRALGDQTVLAFHNLVTKYIAEEELRQEDVFENPKIERVDNMSDQPIEWLDPRGLIQIENHGDNSDHGSNCHSHYGNICSRTWRPKELRGSVTEKFTPALISDLSMLSDCTFYIDQDKGEIKVTSSTEETLDRAHRKLNNLQREMHRYDLGPEIIHLIETEKEVDFVLRFFTLRKLGRTLRTTLLEHGSQYIADLHSCYVIRLLKLDRVSQQYLAPKTKVQPVAQTNGAGAPPHIWDEFLFKQLGDDKRNPLLAMKEPEAGLMLHKEDLTNGRTTSRKTEMVTQWVQGGSSEVLNPFLPVRERSGGEIPPNDKTGGSTTSSSLDEKWRFIASSVSEAQAPTKPPSPRKRYGKVRKPKGAKTSESVAVTNILPEEIEPGTVSNQTPEPGDDLEPIEEIADAVLSEANPSEGSISARASREGSEPKTDRIRSRRIFTPPEILPPFTTPTTVSIFQDHPPDQSPVWETRHAHAAKVGILVDVSAPLDNSKEVPKPPPGYESSPLNTGPGHSQAPSQQLINLHAASEDEYPSLRPPSRPEDPKTQRSSMGPPSRPLKVGSRTLRIVKPKGSVSGSSSTADSGTSKEIRNKPLQEILQSSTEVNSREYKYTMGQQKPAQKKEKVRCDNAAKTEASKADLRKLNDLAEVVLDRALYFRGEVKLEVQIGRILVNSLPTQFRKMPFRVDTWPTIFAARNGSGVAETTFTKMLTTSSGDAVFIRDLISAGRERMFHKQPTGYSLTYDFVCLTKEGEEINLVIDENSQYQIQKRPVMLGSINWFYPKRTWDAKMTLSGRSCITGAYEEAVEAIVNNLYIPNGKTLLDLVTKTVGKELRVQSITLHRQTRYGCVSRPSILLSIAEVQDLHIQRLPDLPDLIRACAKPQEEMIRDNRLWYEVSLSSSVAEDGFKENGGMELGDVANWTPKEMLEKGVMEDLSIVARDVVTRIDGVGYYNKGPRGGPSDGGLTTPSTTNAEQGPGFW